MVTYQMQAKHAVAASEWVKAIMECKLDKKLKTKNTNNLQEDMEDPLLQEEIHYLKPELHIKVKDKLKKIKLKDKDITIGRSSASTVQLSDKHVSREHCKLSYKGPCKWILVDLGSHSGTQVNGQSVTRYLLKPGDKIVIGSTEIFFQAKDSK